MTQIKPFIKCVDYWPEQIPDDKLAAYKAMIEAGQIRNHHVIHNQRTGGTVIEYYSTVPHEWIREEMKRMCS